MGPRGHRAGRPARCLRRTAGDDPRAAHPTRRCAPAGRAQVVPPAVGAIGDTYAERPGCVSRGPTAAAWHAKRGAAQPSWRSRRTVCRAAHGARRRPGRGQPGRRGRSRQSPPVAELEGQPFKPPPLRDLVRRYRLTPALLQYLVVDGRVVRVNEDTAFARSAYDDAVRRLRRHLIEHRTLTVAAARDVLGSSRRYVLPLLEWLDAQKITRRVGDDRILRG